MPFGTKPGSRAGANGHSQLDIHWSPVPDPDDPLMDAAPPPRDEWSTRAAFVVATIGSAVGLGNIWRFSYVVGENGGGAFLVAYLVAVIALGLPLMLAEFALGRRARADVVTAFSFEMKSRRWALAGWLAVIASLAILSYYAIVAGWAYRYFVIYLIGSPAGAGRVDAATHFTAFLHSSWEPVAWQLLVLATAVVAVIAGVRNGIERLNRWLVPLLAAIVVVLAAYSLTLGASRAGLGFLFTPDWSALARPQVWLAAFGQAFFSLGVGLGALATYGSYAPAPVGLPRTALLVAGADTSFALVAGVAIFPAVFAFGLDPTQGPALAFVTLPQVFAVMPGGAWFGLAFFALLSIAALTSAVALVEVPVAAVIKAKRWSRTRATLAIGTLAFVAGVPSALSDSAFAVLRPWGVNILEAIDRFSSNLLLPLGGLSVALAVGWAWPRERAVTSGGLASPSLAAAWWYALRFVVPAAIVAVLCWTALRH